MSTWQAVTYATELGAAFATAVIAGVFLGYIVDVQLGTEFPLFTLLGASLGLAAAVYSMIQMVQWLTRPKKE